MSTYKRSYVCGQELVQEFPELRTTFYKTTGRRMTVPAFWKYLLKFVILTVPSRIPCAFYLWACLRRVIWALRNGSPIHIQLPPRSNWIWWRWKNPFVVNITPFQDNQQSYFWPHPYSCGCKCPLLLISWNQVPWSIFRFPSAVPIAKYNIRWEFTKVAENMETNQRHLNYNNLIFNTLN